MRDVQCSNSTSSPWKSANALRASFNASVGISKPSPMSFPLCLSTSAWNRVPSARSRITRSSSAFMKNLLNFFISSFRVLTKARCSAVSVMSSFFPRGALSVSARVKPSGVSSFAARSSGMFFRHFFKVL